jgi:ribulose-bisphosphate carboxylase large chain
MARSRGLGLSGHRVLVRYHLTGTEKDTRAAAFDICIEQTVEVPEAIIPPGEIREHLVGRLEEFRRLPSGAYEAAISYAVETAAGELPQLLNLLFGNISLKPDIRLSRLELPADGLDWLKGPRFGRDGLRARLGVPGRPLLCTALKPMGLTPKELAEMAYRMSVGGIDLIKDDHGLTDQPFAPFDERVARCAEAVVRANCETGRTCLYLPNVTAPTGVSLPRALFAKEAGAGGVMISPGLTGWDTMRALADHDQVDLPILMHPAFLGSYATHPDSGLSHAVLFGQLPRLAGADACIFPTYGSRFAFSKDDCRAITDGMGDCFGRCKPIFPTPGGGLSLERVPEQCAFYGNEVILLIGGGLRRHGPDLAENCREFARLVSRVSVANT